MPHNNFLLSDCATRLLAIVFVCSTVHWKYTEALITWCHEGSNNSGRDCLLSQLHCEALKRCLFVSLLFVCLSLLFVCLSLLFVCFIVDVRICTMVWEHGINVIKRSPHLLVYK